MIYPWSFDLDNRDILPVNSDLAAKIMMAARRNLQT